jgi:BirA family transcriptional regulator, biotin operon repressor / biotin---[acetyl-CoA-carboxylase] ligase
MHPSLGPPTIDTTLLGLLLNAQDPIPLSFLAHQLSTTPAQLQKHLATLQSSGCTFDHTPTGIRLTDASLGVWCDYLQATTPAPAGNPRLIELYKRTSSTQDAIARLIESVGPPAASSLAVADYQDAGRGRLGRSWVAPEAACLTFSTGILSCAAQPITTDRLMLATSVAVAHALESLPGMPTGSLRIKWPNDILIGPKKLAGILVEQITRASPAGPITASVIGIGINVHLTQADLASLPPEVASRVTSLSMLSVHAHRLSLLAHTLSLLENYIHKADPAFLRDHWRSRSGQLGQHITLISSGRQTSGTVLDIDPHLGLLIHSDQGPILHLPAATTTILS